MKLHGWEKVGSADEYREMIRAEYFALKRERAAASVSPGMEEVKLRLFLSLLERPHQSTAVESERELATNSSEQPAA